MKYFILQLSLLITLCSNGQTAAFEYVFSQNKSDVNEHAIEAADSSFLIVTNEWLVNSPRHSSIIKLNKKGILIKTLTFENDSLACYLKRVVETNYGFLAVGGQINVGKYYLWLVKMDKQLNLISQTLHKVPNILQELVVDTDRDSNVIIGGSISYKNYYLPRLFGAKVTKTGNLSTLVYQYPLDTSILNVNPVHPYVGYFDYMITMKDSARHVYFDGGKMVSVDSNFNVVHKVNMPNVPNFYFAYNPTVLRLTDTSYYVAGEGDERISGKKTLYFSEMTLSGRYRNFAILGSQDTFEHIATQHSLDTTKNGDIYIGSTFNYPISCAYPLQCGDTAVFFSLRKLDKRLNTIWQKRYGKDGQFIMMGLISTRDAGCLMYGVRYLNNPITRKIEGIVIKVDGNGIVTSETTIPIVSSSITAFPNPSNGQLNFRKEAPSVSNAYFELNLFDMSGKLVFQKKETDLSQTFDLSHLAKGNYLYQIKQGETIKAIGKWVKIP